MDHVNTTSSNDEGSSRPLVVSDEALSHSEMKEVFHEAVKGLLSRDAILNDLHPDITHQEVSSLLEVEAGRSMQITVLRADGKEWPLRVPREARLHTLKAALRTRVSLDTHREGKVRSISWRSVWKRYQLFCPETKQIVLEGKLEEQGITHKTCLTFKPKRRKK